MIERKGQMDIEACLYHNSLLVAVSVPYFPSLPNSGLQIEARLKLGR